MDGDGVVEGYRVVERVEGEVLDKGYRVYVYVVKVWRELKGFCLVGC